jgi:hypothetical protein
MIDIEGPLSWFSPFANRGSSQSAQHKFDKVWPHRLPIPVGGGGGIVLVQMISTGLRYAKGGGGRASTLWN